LQTLKENNRVRGGFSLLVLVALIIGVAGGVAFGGGVLYGRTTALTPKATAVVAARPAATPTSAPGGAGGGRGGGGGGGLQGAIDSVNGNTLAVRTQQGTLTKVNLGSTTRINTTAPASSVDLKPGTIVTIAGQPDDAGTIGATEITITPVDTALPLGGGANVGAGGAAGSGRSPAGGSGQRPLGSPTP
jgi:hypothetical protein